MKQQTAMQGFSKWLKKYEHKLPLDLQIIAKKYLKLEKEQIKNIFLDGELNILKRGNDSFYEYENVEDYFNKNYKNKQQC